MLDYWEKFMGLVGLENLFVVLEVVNRKVLMCLYGNRQVAVTVFTTVGNEWLKKLKSQNNTHTIMQYPFSFQKKKEFAS